ncbi:hypothetical protein THAOC_22954 [Thalassiosira oceanica]|uniref:MYND-type domain-containing protein n=1 Tax=Thalassiosira oceanica TaxID=159749 RepID=K0RT69_THAOC|nr:hypothetical protein THAOC_22954 [Thalassiosira oceanica]|eukprot:EJK57048.1 hypothetical protein THAOC_22954 [Thalassiosira oceanica]
MGDKDSIENIKREFMEGIATKEQYAEALKGYQDAVGEMKSCDRDEAMRAVWDWPEWIGKVPFGFCVASPPAPSSPPALALPTILSSNPRQSPSIEGGRGGRRECTELALCCPLGEPTPRGKTEGSVERRPRSVPPFRTRSRRMLRRRDPSPGRMGRESESDVRLRPARGTLILGPTGSGGAGLTAVLRSRGRMAFVSRGERGARAPLKPLHTRLHAVIPPPSGPRASTSDFRRQGGRSPTQAEEGCCGPCLKTSAERWTSDILLGRRWPPGEDTDASSPSAAGRSSSYSGFRPHDVDGPPPPILWGGPVPPTPPGGRTALRSPILPPPPPPRVPEQRRRRPVARLALGVPSSPLPLWRPRNKIPTIRGRTASMKANEGAAGRPRQPPGSRGRKRGSRRPQGGRRQDRAEGWRSLRSVSTQTQQRGPSQPATAPQQAKDSVRPFWPTSSTETSSPPYKVSGCPAPQKGGERPTDPAGILNITMSCVPVADDGDEACANCGKQGGDTVKLKSCTACRLVKYCGVDCQRDHRKQHKKTCKQRAAELKDEELYSQGHKRPEGEFCPLCTLPIPLPKEDHSFFKVCCMKRICKGCDLAAQRRGMFDCPFCRAPLPGDNADKLAMIRARVKQKDPEAIFYLGQKYFFGSLRLQKDVRRAVELWTEAAELGSIDALYNLAIAYDLGEGVQQDKDRGVHFLTKAAMQGNVQSRYNLGCFEREKGNHDHAVKHFLISAKMGDKNSVEMIKKLFMGGLATKKQYAEAMRGHQDAVEEMKSHDRDEAKAINL